MKSQTPDIPTGQDHLLMIDTVASITKKCSADSMATAEEEGDLALIGTALSALYQAATCHRRCYGGGHVLESLCGRAYNLGSSAYLLASFGYYDEALNLVRGIGEIANIVSLSVLDKKSLREWLEANPNTRRKKFSPARVRRILEERGRTLMYADSEWYAKFCELYTHVGPGTRPNLHNDAGIPVAGGVYQKKGFQKSLDELATVLGFLGLQICKYFDFDDLFEQMVNCVETAERSGCHSDS